KRRVSIRPQGDGTARTTIIGEPTDAERLLVLLDRIREAEATADPDTGRYPSIAQQRYDALVSLLRRELAQDTVDRATVVIHADGGLLADAAPNGPATTAGGTSVAAETVRRHCCDGRIEWAIDGPDGTTLGIRRASRIWPPWLTRLIRHRDQHCRFPG